MKMIGTYYMKVPSLKKHFQNEADRTRRSLRHWPRLVVLAGPELFCLLLACAEIIISPSAGLYYWQRAFRKDIVEIQLGMSDDFTETTLLLLGSLERPSSFFLAFPPQDTIEELQNGVRFQPTAQRCVSFLTCLEVGHGQALQAHGEGHGVPARHLRV